MKVNMAQTRKNIQINAKLNHDFEAVFGELGHLTSDNLIKATEAAGVAGKWDDGLDITLDSKSAWAEAAVKKEIRKNEGMVRKSN